jgi:hypothetical protein
VAEVSAPAAVSGPPPAGLLAVASAPAGLAADPAGEGEAEEGREPAEAEPERPAGVVPDVQEKLRGLDLYEPTADPDRPGPLSGQPAGRPVQGQVARVPAAAAAPADPDPTRSAAPRCWAGPAEGVRAVVYDLGVVAAETSAADAVFVRPPSEWAGQR